MVARKTSILKNENPRSALGCGLSQCSSFRSRELATMLRTLTKKRRELVDRLVDISIIDSRNSATGRSSKYIPCTSMRVRQRLRFGGYGPAKVYVDV